MNKNEAKSFHLAGPSKERLHVSSVECRFILFTSNKNPTTDTSRHTEECCALSPTRVPYTPARRHSEGLLTHFNSPKRGEKIQSPPPTSATGNLSVKSGRLRRGDRVEAASLCLLPDNLGGCRPAPARSARLLHEPHGRK